MGFIKVDNKRKSFGKFGQQYYFKLDVDSLLKVWETATNEEKLEKIKSLQEDDKILVEEKVLLDKLLDMTLPF